MADQLDIAREPGHPDPRRWRALAVLLVASFMDLLDGNIVNVGLPSIRAELGASQSQTQWLVAGYTLAFASVLITGGRLGDRFGHRRVFLVGVVGFAVASALCVAVAAPEQLVVTRAVQGVFAGLMVPQVLAIVHLTFTQEEVGRVVAMYAAVAGLAIVSGPVLGGVLVESDLFGSGWRSIFMINIPIGLATALFGAQLIAESRTRRSVTLDLRGVGLAIAALLLLLIPVVQGNELDWPTWSIALMVLSVPVLASFVVHIRRRAAAGLMPLVPPDLFRVRAFAGSVGAQLVFQAAPAALFFVWTIYVQGRLGWSPLRTGLSIVPFCVLLVVSGGVSAQIMKRWGRGCLFVGIALMLVGVLLLAVLVKSEGTGLITWYTVGPFALIGAGMGQIMAPLTTFALSGVPPHEAGAASGLLNVALQLGAAVGVALVGLIYFQGTDGPDAVTDSSWLVGALLAVAAMVMLVIPRAAAASPVPAAGSPPVGPG